MDVAVLCTALMGILVFGLGFAVSLTRGATKVNYGGAADPTDALYKVSRAHGNSTEYAAMMCVLMLYVGANDPAEWMVWTMMVMTGSRYSLVIGMITGKTMDAVNPLRAAGATGTYICGLALVAAALMVT
jgi:uncharacterized protein